MDTHTDNIDENDPIVDETATVEDIDAEAAESDERPRDRGRGRRGRRPFGPNRPYRFALFVEDDGGFVLRSPDLAERSANIASLDELSTALQSAIDERASEDAAAQAEAEKDEQFSGKFVLRLPRSMHRQLTELAETEGVSLNQLALGFLAEGLGRAETIHEAGERRGKHRGPRGGRGPWGHGPRGDRGPEGHGSRGFDRGDRDRFDPPEGRFGSRPDGEGRGHRGRHGLDPARHGRKGPGLRRPRWFMGEASEPKAAPDSPEPNDTAFV